MPMRAYERASAAVRAKYDSDCAPFKTKAPLCDFPPAKATCFCDSKTGLPGGRFLFFLGWMWLWVTSGLRR